MLKWSYCRHLSIELHIRDNTFHIDSAFFSPFYGFMGSGGLDELLFINCFGQLIKINLKRQQRSLFVTFVIIIFQKLHTPR